MFKLNQPNKETNNIVESIFQYDIQKKEILRPKNIQKCI